MASAHRSSEQVAKDPINPEREDHENQPAQRHSKPLDDPLAIRKFWDWEFHGGLPSSWQCPPNHDQGPCFEGELRRDEEKACLWQQMGVDI